jgi:hypothetical protein
MRQLPTTTTMMLLTAVLSSIEARTLESVRT